MVLVACTANNEPREGVDFFPLTVDYEEKQYSVGRIPGGFLRREGRASENGTLTARLIDRPIRPLFPKGFRNDVHVVATILSVDKDCPPDVTATIGASIALNISNIPFTEPLAAVNVGLVDGELIINPNVEQSLKSTLELSVAGTSEAIMMVEGGAHEVPEDKILEAIFFGHDAIKKIVEFQRPIIAECAVEKLPVKTAPKNEAMEAEVRAYAVPILELAVKDKDKITREAKMDSAKAEIIEHFSASYADELKAMSDLIDKITKEIVRKALLHGGERVDGRRMDEIRPISCEVGFLPRPHGSALFTRGQTQVLSVVTLGTRNDAQNIDDLTIVDRKRYIHHYNFPDYSVGEVRQNRSPGRREIGHGHLAERALKGVLPDEKEFPYTIRVVSETLESNGSSSMGSVCGSTLSLLHAGVPLKAPVSGIAMGLVKEGEDFAIMTDIQGIEDSLGDMDFKLAGSEKGVTALQMDIKIAGINREIVAAALKQAREARMFIMDIMMKVISKPSEEMSPYAPRIITVKIHPDRIREVIGPGGKMINKITEDTGCKMDISDDGTVLIYASDLEGAKKAQGYVEAIVAEVEVGRVYNGTVKRIMDFGAFVEIIPGVFGASGKEGLVHISQLAEQRVNKVTDIVSIGDKIVVKVTEIDHQGRINLSRKAVLRQGNAPVEPRQ